MKRAQFPALLLALLATSRALADSTVDPANAVAWGGNVGGLNWRPSTADGVLTGEYVCSGMVWAANAGWINMGSGAPANGIRYQNTDGADCGVNLLADGSLRGLAWGANIGWVNFEPLGDPRVDYATGKLTGYAWGANVGWIHLGDVTFGVATQSIAPGADSDNDGIADAWELQRAGNLLALGGNIGGGGGDYDGDGISDAQEYRADTDPLNPNDRFRITNLALDFDPVVEFSLTWTSSTARSYVIESRESLSTGQWADAGLGTLGGAGGLQTRTFGGPASATRFFRVRACLPLQP